MGSTIIKKKKRYESISFIKEWIKNTKPEIEIGGLIVNQKDDIPFYQNFLESFLSNRGYVKIFGCDICSDFEILLSEKSLVNRIAQDIWDNPRDYYDIDQEENEYYEFIKFLWIKYPDGKEVRLSDIVKT